MARIQYQFNFDHPHKNQDKRSPHLKQVIFGPHTKTKSILTSAQTKVNFGPHTLKTQVNFDPPHKLQVTFDPKTDIRSFADLHSKIKSFSIPIDTLNQVTFDPHTRPSHIRSLHWNQVNSYTPHWNQVYFGHPHGNQVNFEVNTETMTFRPVLFCVLHVRVHVPVIPQHDVSHKDEYQLVLIVTCLYHNKTPKIAYVDLPFFIFYSMVMFMATFDT